MRSSSTSAHSTGTSSMSSGSPSSRSSTSSSKGLPTMSNDRAHADHVHEHPTWRQYKWVALWLFLITVVEVWAYYLPAFVASKAFVPTLLIMSAVKFTIVVM